MGTSNFHNVNASSVFASTFSDQWEYDDFEVDVRTSLKNAGYYLPKYRQSPETELRSYPAHIIGEKNFSQFWGENEVNIAIHAVVRSGYYTGVNLDWELVVNVNSWTADDTSLDGFGWWGDAITLEGILKEGLNPGLAEIHAPNVRLWVENTVDDIVEELETIYRNHTREYTLVAQASNGEAFYREVTPDTSS